MIFWLSLGVENLVEMPIKCASNYDPRLTRNFIALASHWVRQTQRTDYEWHLSEVFFIHFLILCLKWAWRTLQKGTNFLDCTFNYLFNIVTSVFKGENCILLQTCALFGLYFLKFITSRKLCIVLYGLLVCNFFIFGTSISLSITVCQFGSL